MGCWMVSDGQCDWRWSGFGAVTLDFWRILGGEIRQFKSQYLQIPTILLKFVTEQRITRVSVCCFDAPEEYNKKPT